MGHNIMSFQTSASGGGGGAWEELVNEEFTNSSGSTTSSFDVKKFLRIQIIGYDYVKGVGGDGDNPNMMVTFNDEVYSDSNTSYSYDVLFGSDARTSQNAIYLFSAGGTDVATNSEIFTSMDVSNLDSEVHLTTFQCALINGTAASDDTTSNDGAATWEDTTNITKVRFQLTANRGTFDMHIVVLGHD